MALALQRPEEMNGSVIVGVSHFENSEGRRRGTGIRPAPQVIGARFVHRGGGQCTIFSSFT